jgi:hypothetical protein
MKTQYEPMTIALLALASICSVGCAGPGTETEDKSGESETSSEAGETETETESGDTETGGTETSSGTESGDTVGEAFHPSIVSVGCNGDVCIAAFGQGAHAQAISECRLAAMISSGYMQPIGSVWPLTSCESGALAPDSLDCFAAGELSTCYVLIDGWAVQVMPECSGAGAVGQYWPNQCAAGEPVDGSGLLDARCDAEFCSASLGPDFGHARVRLVPECMASNYTIDPNPGECG